MALDWRAYMNADFSSVGLGLGLKFCISNRLLGDVQASGPLVTF